MGGMPALSVLTAENSFAAVQSLIEGRTLREVMRAGERLAPEAMLRWFFRLLEVCQRLVRFLNQPAAFLEPAARPIEH